jgi:hypothetical protein
MSNAPKRRPHSLIDDRERRVVCPPVAAQPRRQAGFGGGAGAASIVPPPRRRASPSHKTKRRGLFPRASRSSTNPSINGSKGEEQPPPRGRGLRSRKNHQHPCWRFFLLQAASMPPPPLPRRSGAYFAHPGARFPITHRVVRPQTAAVTHLCGERYRQ